MPAEFALCAVGPEAHVITLRAIIVATALAMTVMPHIPDTDRAHEIEFQATDVDIGTAFDYLCQNDLGELLTRLVAGLPNFPGRTLQRHAVRNTHWAPPDLQRWLNWPGRDPADKHGAGMGTFC